MGIVSRAADVYYTYRFIRTLVTPWEELDAYKLGLIDGNGKNLKKPSTSEEKDSYTVFFRLVFNIKRILEKLPFGKSRISSYAAALFLLKEQTNMSDEQLAHAFAEAGIEIDDLLAEENAWHVQSNDTLSPGVFKLAQDIASPLTGEMIARRGTTVLVDEGTKPSGLVLGESIYKIKHVQTKQDIYVSSGDLLR
jgi:hypothetical protein|tara:strand:- start:305 stop:886 length:582 start_codon:yes stop_codon:yes gene_type:complete